MSVDRKRGGEASSRSSEINSTNQWNFAEKLKAAPICQSVWNRFPDHVTRSGFYFTYIAARLLSMSLILSFTFFVRW